MFHLKNFKNFQKNLEKIAIFPKNQKFPRNQKNFYKNDLKNKFAF